MKYQRLASIALAALSASTSVSAIPLKPEEDGVCPPGYSASVYYITVTAEPAPVVEPTITSTSTSTSTTTTTSSVVETLPPAGAIETIPAIEEPSEIDPIPSSTLPVEIPTKVAVVKPSATTTEAPVQPTTTTEQAAPAPTTSTPASSDSDSSSNSGSGSSSGSSGPSKIGKATFYGGNVSGGTCSFTDYTLPSHLSGVAYSGEAWNDAAECGSCVSVTGPDGNSIKAMIVDKCPECAPTHLDLFQSAFSELAPISEGIIPISFATIPCDISSPLILKNKEGTSQYWFSMQVVNANEAVKSLEVSVDGGSTWQGTTRSFYNFFENAAGFGSESVDVRVTGVSGKTVVVEGVSVQSGASVTADGNV
ncbi:RlpA-like double-psi beta-barrel-protein domain-containing protein-containing protein [Aspergillus karnatakaensis]|uniref:putative extracellular cellulase CelA/allergen Asp F7-like n=1 Tax=Aspergillus karnatakaensis TaxID=1810916 RepID=UPI003CCDA73E